MTDLRPIYFNEARARLAPDLSAEAERLLDDAELRQRRAKAERAQRVAAEADEYFTEGRQHRRAGRINPHD